MITQLSYIQTPRQKIVFGTGALSSLKEIKAKKAVIVTDNGIMESLGFLEKTVRLLKLAGCSAAVFQGIRTEPDIATVEKVKNFIIKEKPDVIIGLGGGSCLDAGKVGWIWYEHPNFNFDQLINEAKLPDLRKKAYYIAIPTTSGTGSEVTPYAVVSDHRQTPYRKVGISHKEEIPDIAILDPLLPSTMPPSITASTGIDALSHALECIGCKNTNDFTDAFALYAIDLIFKYLPKAYNNGGDIEARSKMHSASCLAGMAIANGGAGIMHSLGQILGAEYGISHGVSVGLFMLDVIKFNSKVAAERYLKIAKNIGFKADEPEEGVKFLLEEIEKLMNMINIPMTIKELKIEVNKENYFKSLDQYAEAAMKDGGTPANIRKATPSDLKELFIKVF
ncbi:MAG: iron-containing alcohol dehydrogenase [Candidatus Humimicrobiaceae bacterium]